MLRFSGWWRRTCGPRRVATRLGCGFLRISLLWVGLLLRISRCLRLRASRWREGLLQRVPRGTRLSRHWLMIRLRRRVLRCLCLGDTRESEKDCACRLQNVSVQSEWNDRLTPEPWVTLGTANRTKTQSHNGGVGHEEFYSISGPGCSR
jgi:hypothetical protein